MLLMLLSRFRTSVLPEDIFPSIDSFLDVNSFILSIVYILYKYHNSVFIYYESYVIKPKYTCIFVSIQIFCTSYKFIINIYS
nr:CPPV094 CC chemokine-like protein [Cooks petrelpox virus]